MHGSVRPTHCCDSKRQFRYICGCGFTGFAAPGGHGVGGFCDAVCGCELPGAAFVEFAGVGAVPVAPVFAPGFAADGFPFVGLPVVGFSLPALPVVSVDVDAFPVEFVWDIVPCAGTHGALPGVCCVGVVCVVPFCGSLCVSSPAALVVIGVGGPIGFGGGVMLGFPAGVFGGAGEAGTVVFGTLVCAGDVVVVGGAAVVGDVVGVVGAVARVRCAPAQVAKLKMAMKTRNRLVIRFPFAKCCAQL